MSAIPRINNKMYYCMSALYNLGLASASDITYDIGISLREVITILKDLQKMEFVVVDHRNIIGNPIYRLTGFGQDIFDILSHNPPIQYGND